MYGPVQCCPEVNCRYRHLRSLTGQCALIFGEALEFVIDVKEPLQESAKFTLGLRLQLRLE